MKRNIFDLELEIKNVQKKTTTKNKKSKGTISILLIEEEIDIVPLLSKTRIH